MQRVQIPNMEVMGGPQGMPAWWQVDNGTYWMRCNCGALLTLADHTIAPDGQVEPSIYHLECGYHEWVTLVDFNRDVGEFQTPPP